MNYKLNWVEKTEYGWKASVNKEDGSTIQEVYLGKEYTDPMAGTTIDANEWKSPKNGKIYLFPAKEKKGNPGYKAQVVEKAMERKETSISKFQDNKEWSIKVSSTMRMAVDLAIAEGKPVTERIKVWREYLWNHWDVQDDQFPPFIEND